LPYAGNSGSLTFKRFRIDPTRSVVSINAFDFTLNTNLQWAFKKDLDELWNLTPCLVPVASEVPRGVDDDVGPVDGKKVSYVDESPVHCVTLF
jgi:hypothetical protein